MTTQRLWRKSPTLWYASWVLVALVAVGLFVVGIQLGIINNPLQ